MKDVQILEMIKEITELDDLTLESSLEMEEWDSLAVVTFLSDIDTEFNIVLSPEKVAKAETISDLVNLVVV